MHVTFIAALVVGVALAGSHAAASADRKAFVAARRRCVLWVGAVALFGSALVLWVDVGSTQGLAEVYGSVGGSFYALELLALSLPLALGAAALAWAWASLMRWLRRREELADVPRGLLLGSAIWVVGVSGLAVWFVVVEAPREVGAHTNRPSLQRRLLARGERRHDVLLLKALATNPLTEPTVLDLTRLHRPR